MLRKTNNEKTGFTIIEVVITIAIGAAVMALVLNAVAGARRSQRNNARSADVNKIAAGINQYIATRNALPADWDDVSAIVEPSKFGHYDPDDTNANASINAPASWTAALPASGSGGSFLDGTSATTTPLATGAGVGGNTAASADKVVVFVKAGCSSTSAVQAGGIREMAITYRLEGQSDISCLEI